MFTTKIEIESADREGCLTAIREVVRHLEEGYTSGFDENEDGESFNWSSNLDPS